MALSIRQELISVNVAPPSHQGHPRPKSNDFHNHGLARILRLAYVNYCTLDVVRTNGAIVFC